MPGAFKQLTFYLEDYFKSRAMQLAGITGNPAYYHDDFMDIMTAHWGAGAGAGVNNTEDAGVTQYLNLNNATHFSNGQFTMITPNVKPWYMAGRFKIVTAVNAGGEIKGVWANSAIAGVGGSGAVVGTNGVVSATNYVFTIFKAGVLTTAISTIPVSLANYVLGELWFNGVNYFGSVEGETPVLIGAAATGPAVAVFPVIGNGVTSAAGTLGMLIDNYFLAMQR